MDYRRIAVAVAATMVAASGVAAHAAPGPAATAAGWAPTATQAQHLMLPALGTPPAGLPIRVGVVLAVPDRAALDAAVTAVSTPGNPSYRHFLSAAAVVARFSPTASQVHDVTSWLAQAGFTGISVSPDRLLVNADSSAAVVERTFDTQLRLYRDGGHTVYANTAAARVPRRLASLVGAVLGLSDLPLHMYHVRALPLAGRRLSPAARSVLAVPSASTTPDLNGFTPVQIAQIYDAASLTPASHTSIAVMASGDMTSTIADLRYAESVYHARPVPVTVVPTAPLAAVEYGNPYTANLEWDLDTQMSTIDAGYVSHLYIYNGATIDDADVARDINLFVSQDLATLGSASLGECDVSAYLDGAMFATDEFLAAGALQGQSFFASAGDNGFACPEIASTGVPGGVPGASWPADGFYTTAVGGTTLLATSSGQYLNEVSWIGGGGGVSEFESAGGWTYQANKAAPAGEFLPSGGRGVPDIAAVADPNTPVVVYQDKVKQYVGGTSVSSPLSMGLYARMETAHRNLLGLAAVNFYLLYNARNASTTVPVDPVGFHDITVGTNGLWTAAPGYDYTTGIGSFDVRLLNPRL